MSPLFIFNSAKTLLKCTNSSLKLLYICLKLLSTAEVLYFLSICLKFFVANNICRIIFFYNKPYYIFTYHKTLLYLCSLESCKYCN